MSTGTLGQLFSEVAACHGQRPALCPLHAAPISYRELHDSALTWAAHLHALGVRRHDVVALFHDKSVDCYAVMLASLMLGAPYVSLDPGNPAERLARIAQRCLPRLVLARAKDSQPASVVAEAVGSRSLDLDDPELPRQLTAAAPVPTAVLSSVLASDPAYLMFTSGSTGFPKGAAMSHANVIGLIDWIRERFEVTAADVFTGLNPAYFDNSVFDFYGALFSGASLAPFPADSLRQPRGLIRSVSEARCTLWFSVPSLIVYSLNLRAIERMDLPALRCMIFGGEGFPKGKLRELHGLIGDRIQLVNVYGPTECTCICSSYDVSEADLHSDELLPLGGLNPGFEARILDPDGVPLPPGSSGELALAGPQVGLGYWRDGERTRAAFQQDPGLPQLPVRMYRTGDLVRQDPSNGSLHFLGRIDHQIKHMGYRIELEEIEHVVGALAEVAENAAVYVREPATDFGRIVLFYAAREDLDDAALLALLRQRLPAYMVPGELHRLPVLPKNANGKIDRPALRQQLANQEAGATPANNPSEH